MLYSQYKWYWEEAARAVHEWMRGGVSTLVGKVPLSACLFSTVCVVLALNGQGLQPRLTAAQGWMKIGEESVSLGKESFCSTKHH